MDWDFPEEGGPPKKKIGRPKGATGKSLDQRLMMDKVEGLYKTIEHMLTPEQKTYYQKAFDGKIAFDPVKHGELFINLFGVYCIGITTKAIQENSASREVADNVNQYRQFLKDLEDMNRKREEWKVKTGEHSDMVDPTRESNMARFKTLH